MQLRGKSVLLMVRCVVGSILHVVDPLSYFSFHDWCNKGRGMCYPVCGMVHIKEPLLLIRKNSPCGGSGFHLSLSEWSFTICPMPYNRKFFDLLNVAMTQSAMSAGASASVREKPSIPLIGF